MISVFSKSFQLFDPKERKTLYYLIPGVIMIGILEVVGIAAIVPFMALVIAPDIIQKNAELHWFYHYFQFSSANNFLIFAGIVVFLILLFGDAFSAFMYWVIVRFVNLTGASITNTLFSRYIFKPYSYFLNENSSDLSTNILNEAKIYTNCVFISCVQIFSKSIGVLFIILLLLVVNPLLSLVAGGVIFGGSLISFSLFKYQLRRANRERVDNMGKQYRIISESFGGIKEVKLFGKERYFLNAFREPTKILARNSTVVQLVGMLPRYVLEVFAFGSMVIILICLLLSNHLGSRIIPLLALYAFAGYRLLPSIQTIFSLMAVLKGNVASLELLYQELVVKKSSNILESVIFASEQPSFQFNHQIKLIDINFIYPGSTKSVIPNLSLTIPVNTTVGFVGETGAGKTTIIDIILGLLVPQHGQLMVDGVCIEDGNRRSWQRCLGYVPQNIFLSDNSIAHNIAFGVKTEEIDWQQVEKVARIAHLHDFISQLPKGYETVIGERGVRLSGGQRQRLGIARALYYDPKVLILDEATNSLDGITEVAIMDAVHDLAHKKTIIIIAHRLATLKECDMVYFLAHGRLINQGTYDFLMASDVQFQKMAYQN